MAPGTSGLQPSLARMLARMIDARDQKAAKAGQVLHDEIGQILSAVGLHLDVLRMDLDEQLPEAAHRIREIQALLEKAFEQVRGLSYDLNPNRAERAGLATALHRLVGECRGSSRMKIRLLCDASTRVSGPAATAMYQIAECALSNALRHSRASKIEIFVRPARGGGAVLEIRDDGCGFDPVRMAANPAGLGLPLMQCFADRAGLNLNVESAPGKGTIVRVTLPETGA